MINLTSVWQWFVNIWNTVTTSSEDPNKWSLTATGIAHILAPLFIQWATQHGLGYTEPQAVDWFLQIWAAIGSVLAVIGAMRKFGNAVDAKLNP